MGPGRCNSMLWVYKFNDTLSERRIFSIFDALNAGFIGASLPIGLKTKIWMLSYIRIFVTERGHHVIRI